MHHGPALTFVAALLACAPERPGDLQEPRVYEMEPFQPPAPIEEPDPVPEREPVSKHPEIYRWWSCHTEMVAHFEFAEGAERSTDVTGVEIERLVTSWNHPPEGSDPLAKVLIMGWRGPDEPEWIADRRAELIYDVLIKAGAEPSLLLRGGFDGVNRTVVILAVTHISCLL